MSILASRPNRITGHQRNRRFVTSVEGRALDVEEDPDGKVRDRTPVLRLGSMADTGSPVAGQDATVACGGTLRALLRLLIVIAIVGGLGYAYAWRSAVAPVERPRPGTFPAEAVKAGATLAAIGNCVTCHTREGGSPYAGGRPIATPFGRVYATNITPDPETGIGRWSENAFQRAMREGVSRDGRHLYPAFPYDHMAKMSDADIKLVYDFMMTRQPVSARAPANDLAFPYNVRSLIAGWKLLYHDRNPFQPNSARPAEWNRGAYLVEGLAHCGACHTPRNWAGAEDRSRAYAGGEAEGWTAPALGATSDAAVPWTAERLAEYLRKGRSAEHGVAAGPMAPVIRNLAPVPDAEIKAMGTYVADLAGAPSAERQTLATRVLARAQGKASAPRGAASGPGAAIYTGACAQCHGEAGRAPLEPALNLALSTSVRAAAPNNLVRIILGGIRQPDNAPGPYMPEFGSALTDRQVVDLVEFVRASFTERQPFTGIDVAVSNARQQKARF